MKVYNKKILASILFVIIGTVCLAQVDNPPPSPETQGSPTPPVGTPIDGLTAVFAVIGAVYGIRKVIQNSNEH